MLFGIRAHLDTPADQQLGIWTILDLAARCRHTRRRRPSTSHPRGQREWASLHAGRGSEPEDVEREDYGDALSISVQRLKELRDYALESCISGPYSGRSNDEDARRSGALSGEVARSFAVRCPWDSGV